MTATVTDIRRDGHTIHAKLAGTDWRRPWWTTADDPASYAYTPTHLAVTVAEATRPRRSGPRIILSGHTRGGIGTGERFTGPEGRRPPPPWLWRIVAVLIGETP